MGEHTGGGKIGMITSSWPFGKLTIRADGITISIGIREVRFRREDIKSILFKKGLINKRFVFVHEDDTIKKVIEFWTFSPGEVLSDLEARGYSVTESK
ncbi:MAG TPA: hypothetical protein DDY17_07530 [Syntrophaceae bacterium]|jgi:hypothetical protein|nr:hypothetical protein [Syntrophaceae bacterium]